MAVTEAATTTRAVESVTVVVPTYNERATVGAVIDRSLAALAGYDPEVVVVDDDSPDGTSGHVRSEYAADDRVRVVTRVEESGLATAIARGFDEATGDVCVVVDADLQHPPERIPDLVGAFEDGVDVVVGSRYTEGGGVENWSWTRRAVSAGAGSLAKAALPDARGLSDPMSGFFAVRRSVVAGVEFEPRGYKLLLEVLTRADVGRVVEVPYVFSERSAGESNLTADQYVRYVEHLGMLACVSADVDRFVDPHRGVAGVEFAAVGALGVLVNTLVFATLLAGGLHYALAGGVAFLAAMNVNFLGNWAVSFDRPDGDLAGQYLKYASVAVVGFAVYAVTLSAAIDGAGIAPIGANLLAIGVSGLWNFVGAERVAFDVDYSVGSSR